LSIANAGESQLGVQILAQRATPACIIAAGDGDTNTQPALLLPGAAAGQQATLITTAASLHKGSNLTLTVAAGAPTAARIERIIERGTHFQHLAIRPRD